MWAFSESPLDRRSSLRLDEQAVTELKTSKRTKLLVFNERYQILMQPDGVHPVNAIHRAELPKESHWIYLGHLDDDAWFSVKVYSNEFECEYHQQWHDLRMSVSLLPAQYASVIAYSKALHYWHRHHQFCGKCGNETQINKSGHERTCSNCEKSLFPRTDPAIIVSVTHNDNLLLARQASWPDNRYSVLAGFVEPGESFEHAVIREVYEESGLTVTSPTYVGSQPWPFPGSIMVGFTAEAEHPEFELLDNELESALWVEPHSIINHLESGAVKMPNPYSISFHLIKQWANKHNINLANYETE